METLLRLREISRPHLGIRGTLDGCPNVAANGRRRAINAPGFDDGGRLTGCGCPNNKLSVRPDGGMVPCNLLAHLEMGRINQDPCRMYGSSVRF